jgi:gliding motility-associated-like protein
MHFSFFRLFCCRSYDHNRNNLTMIKKLLFSLLLALTCAVAFSQVPAKFIFFKGDTLDGFDVEKNYSEILSEGYDARDSYVLFHRRQDAFVKSKYKMTQPSSAAGSSLPVVNMPTTPCNNLDFEAGSWSGWVGGYGYNQNAGALNVTNNAISTLGLNSAETSCSYHTLVNRGTDPYSGLPMVDPGGGTYAARLGGEWMNICSSYWNPPSRCYSGYYNGYNTNNTFSGGEFLQQTFRVTKSNAMLSYNYSVVMDDSPHPKGQQPYFRVEVLDSTGKPVDPCVQYYVESLNGVPPKGFVNSPVQDCNLCGTFPPSNVYYSPWTSNSINLTTYLGRSITVRFTAAGCVIGGHFAYAYVDASCGPVQLVSPSPLVCGGQSMSLGAPPTGPGGSYQWSTIPPGQPGIISATNNQNVTINASGTYEVLVTLPSGCKYKIDTTIVFKTNPVLTTSSKNPICNGSKNGSINVGATAGTAPYTYTWTPSPTFGQGTPSASGLGPGTYTVLVTTADGCSSSTQVTITQPAPLVASNITTAVSCNGLSDGSATASATGAAGTLTYSWSPTGGTGVTASGLPAGTYTCTITDGKSCSGTTIATINQPAVLNVNCTPTNIACHGGTVGSATASVSGGTTGYTYSWSPSGGNAAIANNLPAGTYTCTVSDAHNCKSSATATISEPPAISLATSSIPTPCAGLTGSASVVASGGTGAYTYSWNPGGGNTATITIITSGLYTITVKDNNGCTQSAIVPVSNTGGPSAVVNPPVNVSCYGLSDGSATIHGSGGTGTLTYSWSPRGGSGTTDTTASSLPAGTYNVQVVDAAGCQIIKTITISQPTQITANITASDVSCKGGSNGSALVNASGGTPAYSYSWSPLGGTAQTGSPLPAGNYTCSITDSKGCKTSSAVTINEPAAITITTSTGSVSCHNGSNGTASANATGGNAPYAYAWTPSGGNAANAAGLPAGNYTCTVTDSKGCSSKSIVTVTQPAAFSFLNVVTPVDCNGNTTGAATISPSGGALPYTYSWTPAVSSTQTISGVAAGTYTCIVTDSSGCSFSAAVVIPEPNLLTAGTSGTDISCNGLTDGSASVSPNGGTAPYAYSWTPGGATTQNLSGLPKGTYICNVTDLKGCKISSVITITEPSAINVSLSAGIVPCFGGNNGIDTASATGGTGVLTYNWMPTGGTAYTATGLSAGTYTCTVKDGNGCIVVKTVTMAQNAVISANSSDNPANCLSHNGSASVAPTGGKGPYQYSWSPGNATTSTIGNLPSGTFACTITDTLGCSVQVSVVVPNVPGAISAHFGTSVLTGTAPLPVNFTDSSKGGPVSWSWDFGDQSTATGPNPSHTYTVAGTYQVTETVHDANGCISTYTITMDVSPLPSWIKIPNVFTPNGDGVNDSWQVLYQGIKIFNAKIYDRWGVYLAELLSPASGWDGHTLGGSTCVPGTYFYLIHAEGIDGKTYDFQGYMMMIRD